MQFVRKLSWWAAGLVDGVVASKVRVPGDCLGGQAEEAGPNPAASPVSARRVRAFYDVPVCSQQRTVRKLCTCEREPERSRTDGSGRWALLRGPGLIRPTRS